MAFLRRKLEVEIEKTVLDACIVANIYHAEIYFYDALLSEHHDTTTFHFMQKAVYNFNLPDGKKRPKWILVRDRHQYPDTWYAVTSELTSDMVYNFRPDCYGSFLLERSDELVEMLN